jgi:uncharacterized protein with GYD domain
MTIYITQGRYTGEAMKSFLAKPEDRSAAAKAVIEAAGGKVHGFYFTFGEYDFLVISEAPSEKDMVAGLLAVAAGGAVTGLKTTVAMTGADAKAAMEKAKGLTSSYRAPGA